MTSPSITLERMREQIAAILEQPVSVIEDGANLLDLGLDSMRMMELATRWSDECGLYVDFASLAEHPEIRTWWRLVSDREG